MAGKVVCGIPIPILQLIAAALCAPLFGISATMGNPLVLEVGILS